MGNVRNPVGPLPSSIYWRRRAVVLCLFAIVVALVAWVVVPHGGSSSDSGKGGGTSGSPAPGGGGGHRTPLPSITPGPTSSQTGITTEPGGRGSGGSGDGGSGGGAADAGADGGGSGGAGSGGSSVGEAPLPPGTSVPDCSGSGVTLSVRSVRGSYQPGQQPEFAISAVNSGDTSCKVNFSAANTAVTVVNSGGHHMWSTADCPPDHTPYLLAVPAGGSTIDDVSWDRAVSAPDCATPSGSRTASPGGYQVKVAIPGLGSAHTSFELAG